MSRILERRVFVRRAGDPDRFGSKSGTGETRRGERVRPSIPTDPTIREHLVYLMRMADEKVIDRELARQSRTVWYATWVETGGVLPVPAAAALPGGPVEYHWAVGPHQLSIEIFADEPCHWFYRNNATGATWGCEAPITDGVPEPFVQYLQRYLTSAGR